MVNNKGYETMILELICMFILVMTMISVIVISWEKQKRKHHMRYMAWMEEQLNNRRSDDNSRNNG